MNKPHSKSTLKYMKEYIKSNELNKKAITLGLKKADMIKTLKKLGHWDSKNDKIELVFKSKKKEESKPKKKVEPKEELLNDKKLIQKLILKNNKFNNTLNAICASIARYKTGTTAPYLLSREFYKKQEKIINDEKKKSNNKFSKMNLDNIKKQIEKNEERKKQGFEMLDKIKLPTKKGNIKNKPTLESVHKDYEIINRWCSYNQGIFTSIDNRLRQLNKINLEL